MGEVVDLNCLTRLDIPAERVLQSALDVGLTGVVVIGYAPDGSEYFAASYADGGEVLWLLARAQLKLLRQVDR